jgi:TolB-like protein
MGKTLLALCLAAFALAACSNMPGSGVGVANEKTNSLISSSYRAVDELVAHPSRPQFVSGRKILVATVVNLNRLNESSSFGRLVAEHAASRLAQLGASVSEMKLRGNLFVSERQGELLLSREVRDISNSYNADAVLVGTYVEAQDQIYVTFKLVRAQDAQILSAFNYSIEKQRSIGNLLRE